MASAQVVETSVANDSPPQDYSQPDGHFQSRYALKSQLFSLAVQALSCLITMSRKVGLKALGYWIFC